SCEGKREIRRTFRTRLYPTLQIWQKQSRCSGKFFQNKLYVEDITTMVLCKPKLLPLKSLTLEKLEKMQQAAQDTIRQQEMTEKEQKITH
uniref:Uncharacterized protein n=1 Tax=Ovis aries TaxID=9940 RepID=A0AC11EVM5_SHEEP